MAVGYPYCSVKRSPQRSSRLFYPNKYVVRFFDYLIYTRSSWLSKCCDYCQRQQSFPLRYTCLAITTHRHFSGYSSADVSEVCLSHCIHYPQKQICRYPVQQMKSRMSNFTNIYSVWSSAWQLPLSV